MPGYQLKAWLFLAAEKHQIISCVNGRDINPPDFKFADFFFDGFVTAHGKVFHRLS